MRGKQIKALVERVAALDECDVADERGPGASTGDRINEQRPVDCKLREGRAPLNVPEDVTEAGSDCARGRSDKGVRVISKFRLIIREQRGTDQSEASSDLRRVGRHWRYS